MCGTTRQTTTPKELSSPREISLAEGQEEAVLLLARNCPQLQNTPRTPSQMENATISIFIQNSPQVFMLCIPPEQEGFGLKRLCPQQILQHLSWTHTAECLWASTPLTAYKVLNQAQVLNFESTAMLTVAEKEARVPYGTNARILTIFDPSDIWWKLHKTLFIIKHCTKQLKTLKWIAQN